MIPGGTFLVHTRYTSHPVSGAGRVTATARGVRRTVPVDPATSGGMTLEGTRREAVAALLVALNLPGDLPAELVGVYVGRWTFAVNTTTTQEETAP